MTLAEEVRRSIMKTMTANRLKLLNYPSYLAPVQQSRLEKEKKKSNKWTPLWSGDPQEQRFEVNGWPSNMVLDLGKYLYL